MSSNLPTKLLSPYNPANTEPRIYGVWEQSGLFNPDKNLKNKKSKAFTIIMPPPNATGTLHMGHAMGIAIQDSLIRYHRMKGYVTLWLPGTDHAAIATQSKVEKIIKKKEGKSRHDLGREKLLKRIDDFVKDSQDTIIEQTRAMGASCDWSRLAFTLDNKRNLAVRIVFKKMFDDGIIYRGNRIVNWDPKGQTTISDDEIVYEERKTSLYTFKYSKDFPIAISTTRPETKLGDTAVAVNPDDKRYKEYVGNEYDVEFCGVSLHIKIIADKEVDMKFGTGALGVTPAHSMIDWAIAERHNLPKKQVINEYAKITVGNKQLNGKKVLDARSEIVEWLKDSDLLIKEEQILQKVSTAERTGGIIEPLPKLQWFINVNQRFFLPKSNIDGIRSGEETTLKQLMRQVVETGQIQIEPEHFSKTYFHWIDNLQDWCISRQIWYGHRIPVWYKGKEILCDTTEPSDSDWVQDEDTLDTWFSSGLWTFSTLGWPESTADLQRFHPTDIMETGRDLIFFWVARMILMTTYSLGNIPFRKVYLHGMVRDEKGRKMSKSLDNGIDPVEIARKYGADAGRMALMVGAAAGTDTNISENKIKGYKHFCNKLWNIARFVLSATDNSFYDASFSDWSAVDKVLIKQRDEEIKNLTDELDQLKIHLATDRIYQYTWKVFADKIIEDSKEIMSGDDNRAVESRAQFLLATLRMILIVLHPFMPFVTEEIWSMTPDFATTDEKLLITEAWPI